MLYQKILLTTVQSGEWFRRWGGGGQTKSGGWVTFMSLYHGPGVKWQGHSLTMAARMKLMGPTWGFTLCLWLGIPSLSVCVGEGRSRGVVCIWMVLRESHQERCPRSGQGQQMGQEVSNSCSWPCPGSGLDLALVPETRFFLAAACRAGMGSDSWTLVLGSLLGSMPVPEHPYLSSIFLTIILWGKLYFV